jgi:hypothetical protein
MSVLVVEKRRTKKKKGPAQPKAKVKPPVPMRPEVEVQKTVAGARKLAKGEDFTEALQMMAQAFEGLDNAEGVVPWEPGTLLAWAQEQRREVELMALFVVSLEDPEGVEFPMHEALQAWDNLSVLAFSTWAARVWWVR